MSARDELLLAFFGSGKVYAGATKIERLLDAALAEAAEGERKAIERDLVAELGRHIRLRQLIRDGRAPRRQAEPIPLEVVNSEIAGMRIALHVVRARGR